MVAESSCTLQGGTPGSENLGATGCRTSRVCLGCRPILWEGVTVSDELSDKQIHFTGTKCCLFDYGDAAQAAQNMSLEKVEDCGRAYMNADGTVRHWLFTWDDGRRTLQRCTRCGALFLVQHSEFHSSGEDDDDYYTDWFQVDDEAAAELINATWDGFALESRYDGPGISKTNGRYAFRSRG